MLKADLDFSKQRAKANLQKVVKANKVVMACSSLLSPSNAGSASSDPLAGARDHTRDWSKQDSASSMVSASSSRSSASGLGSVREKPSAPTPVQPPPRG